MLWPGCLRSCASLPLRQRLAGRRLTRLTLSLVSTANFIPPASWPPDLLLTGTDTRDPREAVPRLTPEGRFLFGSRAEGDRDPVALRGEPVAERQHASIRSTNMT